MTIVLEFYANAKDVSDFTVIVWGKQTKFNSSTINRYYQIPIPNMDHVSQVAESLILIMSEIQFVEK